VESCRSLGVALGAASGAGAALSGSGAADFPESVCLGSVGVEGCEAEVEGGSAALEEDSERSEGRVAG
jgi:hypothetical protein